jgi:hypothetical protein
MLRTGQAGTRSQVPWNLIGPGSTLVTFSTAATNAPVSKPGRTSIYLIDPQGGQYLVYETTTATLVLNAWSGDKQRALIYVTSKARVKQLDQLTLATGRLTRIPLPAGVQSLGYTRPDGTSLLAYRRAGRDDELARYTLSGRLERNLAKLSGTVHSASDAEYSPNGETIAVSYTSGTKTGVELVRNTGGIVRRLAAPKACFAASWWTASALQVLSCNREQVYVAPVTRTGQVKLLTGIRRPSDWPGYWISGAWQLSSGLYAQFRYRQNCALDYIGKVGHRLVAPPSGLDGVVVTATRSELLLSESNCSASQSLEWFNPAAWSVVDVLTSTSGERGVTSSVPYYDLTSRN